MKFFFLSFLIPVFSWGSDYQMMNTSWKADQGELTYHVNFVLKNVEATSKNVRGKGVCGVSQCHFIVASPIKDFISGDANRDLHMIEVTHGALSPLVVANIDVPALSENDISATVKIDFAGQSKVYKNMTIHANKVEDNIRASGKIKFRLSEFNVERPSLLGVKIDDEIVLDYEINFKKTN